jgi:hypothetical protein
LPLNIGQPPASPAEQSRGGGGVGGAGVDASGVVVAAGELDVEELWHPGAARAPHASAAALETTPKQRRDRAWRTAARIGYFMLFLALAPRA